MIRVTKLHIDHEIMEDYNVLVSRVSAEEAYLFTKQTPILNVMSFLQETPLDFIEKYYNDDLSERDSSETKWAVKWLSFVRGDNVLSVGCGPNFYDDVQFFPAVPKRFYGIDVNKNNIAFLKYSKHSEIQKWKMFLKHHFVRMELRCGSILKEQPEYANQFDTIYAMGVLGMFSRSETTSVFKYLNTYLKSGGLLIDIDWTDCHLPSDKLRERKNYRWYSQNDLSINEIGNIIEDTGHHILKEEIYTVTNPETYGWGTIYGFIAQKS